uniref:Uncharacterized protein n=1 Tax=Acrobeloides nanus TaxID=290746 RepID=A0A914EI89_9BILA
MAIYSRKDELGSGKLGKNDWHCEVHNEKGNRESLFGSMTIDDFTFRSFIHCDSRPITYLTEEFENERALRPIDFIMPKITLEPPLKADEENYVPILDTKEKAIKAFKSGAKRIEEAWQLFTHEYLKALREVHHKNHRGSKYSPDFVPKLNEIVISIRSSLEKQPYF